MAKRSLLWLLAAGISVGYGQTFYWHSDPQFDGDGAFGKTFNWTSNQDGTGIRPKSKLDDDFADTTMAPWTYEDSVLDGFSQSSFVNIAGKLTLINRGNDVWGTTNKFAGLFRSDIQGNFDVTVKVESQTKTDSWAKSGIMAVNDAKNLNLGGYCIVAATPGNGVTFQVDSAGTIGTLDKLWSTGADTALFPVWLRLVKSEGVFTAFYRKAISATWIQVGLPSTPLGPAANSQIGIFNNSHNPGISDTTVFDDFEGGGDLQSTALDLSFNGTGPTHNVNATVTGNAKANSLNFGKYSGTFSFGTATLALTGNAAFSPAMAVASTVGTLSFTGDAGTQVLTPPNTSPSGKLPAVVKTGNSILKIGGPFNAASLSQSGGTLDFNGFDFTLTGNLQVTAGAAGTFANLGGRTLIVGSASLSGSAGSLLGLNPATAWYIKASGSLTADYATLGHGNASGTRGEATSRCTDAGGNVSWDFSIPAVVPVKIVRQTPDTTVKVGLKAVFSVSVTGDKPITFQWRKKGDSTVLATDSIFTIKKVAAGDNGSIFICKVANAGGQDSTLESKLSVTPLGCDSVFAVSKDTSVDESQTVNLKGIATCAVNYSWSTVSGPGPRILDPEVLALSFAAPRVSGDSIIVYRFTADFGSGPVSKDIRVTIREAIPDPAFTLPEQLNWNGTKALVIRPTLTNKASLLTASYNPPIVYQWSLSVDMSDSSHAGDSLTLSNPAHDGNLDVTLCGTNGGTVSCRVASISISLATTSLATQASNLSPVSLDGCALLWNSTRLVIIRDHTGRTLWMRHGTQGYRVELSRHLLRLLKNHQAWMDLRL